MSMLTGRFRAGWARVRGTVTAGGRLRVVQGWALALGPLALLLALVAPYRVLFFVAYVYLLLALASYGWLRVVGPLLTLRRRTRGEWAQVGDQLAEDWELHNRAPLPLLWLEVDDRSSLPGYGGRRVVAAGPDDAHRWQTSAVCTRRGVYTLGPLTARTADPLGLFSYEWHDSAARRIVVYPPLVHLPPLTMPRGQRGGLARADMLQVHTTPSVGGLREYVPGDVPSRIHWPTVARTEKLMVKEFDQERAGALWIALDLHAVAWRGLDARPRDHAAGGRDEYTQRSAVAAPAPDLFESPLELAVCLACSLAAQALGEGRAVGLLANDGQPRLLTPGRGPRQLWRVLGELVDAQAVGELPLGGLLQQGHSTHAGQAGAALVVITPATDGAWLPALATWLRGRPGGALALLVAHREADARPLADQLAASGIAAQTFTPSTPLALINPPRPQATLRVSPLGRVVAEAREPKT